MLRVLRPRILHCLRSRHVGQSTKILRNNERYLQNDVIKKPLLDRKTVLKTGILTGAVLVGGIFVKVHSATAGKDGGSSEHPEEKSEKQVGPNLSLISPSEAIQQCRDLIQRKKDETGSPGFVIAVSVDGKDIWTEGFGYSDVENRLKCTPDTIFRIASISKSITMTAVVKLWENGDLDLDKPVQFYVPEFPEKTWDGEKVTITTRQLLSHLAGIRHYNKDYMKRESNPQKDGDQKNRKSNTSLNEERKSAQKSNKTNAKETKDEMQLDEYYIKDNYASVLESLKLFKDDPLVHKPESKFLYTSHGWTLVSAVAEKASQMTFENFLKEVLDELGLENTYLDEHKPLIYNRGRHYVKNKKGHLENAPYVDLSYKWAGGGLISNVLDLTKFGNAMLYSYQARYYSNSVHSPSSSLKKSNLNTPSGKDTDSSRKNENEELSSVPGYLKPDTMEMIWTQAAIPEGKWEGIADGGYGLGWSVWTSKKEYEFCKEKTFFVSHTGGAVGASSVLLILPKECANTENQRSRKIKADENDNMTYMSYPPKGVVVVIIANLTSIGLNKTAYKIARIFERVDTAK